MDFFLFFLLKYLFCSGFPSVRAVWLCDCLSFYCFPVKLKGMLSFHCRICDHSIGYRDGFSKHLRDVLWGDIFNLDACLAHNKFFEFGQVVIKIKSRVFSQALFISMVFSFLYFLTEPIKIIFSYIPTGKFCMSKVKFWWLPVYATKEGALPPPLMMAPTVFRELLIVFSTKVDLVPPI